MLQQAVVNAGKVDITGREAGFSKAGVMELIASPSPAPGNFITFISEVNEICRISATCGFFFILDPFDLDYLPCSNPRSRIAI